MASRIVEVVASHSVRVNLGNYEGTEVFVSMKAEVSEGTDSQLVAAGLAKRVSEAALLQVVAVTKARGKRVDEKALRKAYGFA